MPEKINVYYWMGSQPSECKFAHNSIFTYSKKQRNNIVDYFLDMGYEVMIRRSKEFQIILIDIPGGRFRQR